ncbi:MAG: hypothetical protein H0V89_14115 [Deltaproteobacteria bacterium]|nr:hypothetical protein [Deltaproteobacteria bacterium]
MEAAGGSLRLSSRPGIGTTAQILLPAQRGGDTNSFEVDDDDDTEQS